MENTGNFLISSLPETIPRLDPGNSRKDNARIHFLAASLLEQSGKLDEAVHHYKASYDLDHEMRYYSDSIIEIKGDFYSLDTGLKVDVDPAKLSSNSQGSATSEVYEELDPADATLRKKAKEFVIHLVDLQEQLCNKLRQHFKPFGKSVTVTHGRFESLPEFDCMVSAANSFGLMDGGVDAAITLFFGDQLQKRVQRYILDEFDGEQPVGTSFIISTGNPKHPYLAHTPTMRVPYSIRGTDYVYLAFKAILKAVRDHNLVALRLNNPKKATVIKSVACTGLGTFYGKMDFNEAARQMALAYNNFLNVPKVMSWGFASQRQNQVGFGGEEGFRKVMREQESREVTESRAALDSTMKNLAKATSNLNRF